MYSPPLSSLIHTSHNSFFIAVFLALTANIAPPLAERALGRVRRISGPIHLPVDNDGEQK